MKIVRNILNLLEKTNTLDDIKGQLKEYKKLYRQYQRELKKIKKQVDRYSAMLDDASKAMRDAEKIGRWDIYQKAKGEYNYADKRLWKALVDQSRYEKEIKRIEKKIQELESILKGSKTK